MVDFATARMDPDELRHLREMANLSLAEFAARLGVSAEALAAMEAGKEYLPVRFDGDVYSAADAAIREQGTDV